MRIYKITQIIGILLLFSSTSYARKKHEYLKGCGEFQVKGKVDKKSQSLLIYPGTKQQVALKLKPKNLPLFISHDKFFVSIKVIKVAQGSLTPAYFKSFVKHESQVDIRKDPIEKLTKAECTSKALQKAAQKMKK